MDHLTKLCEVSGDLWAEAAAAAKEEAAAAARAEEEKVAAAAAREREKAAAAVATCDRSVLEGLVLELLREDRVAPAELLTRLT